MEITLFIFAMIALIVFVVLMFYLIAFVKKTAMLIDETKSQLNVQTRQLGEVLEKVDNLIGDVNSFVKQASFSLEKVNLMSDQITEVVRRVDVKAKNLMIVADDLSDIVRGVVKTVEHPIKSIADFIGNVGNYVNKIKTFFPTKQKK